MPHLACGINLLFFFDDPGDIIPPYQQHHTRHWRAWDREDGGLRLAGVAGRTGRAYPDVFYKSRAHLIRLRLAAAFALRGYAVFLDGIFGPWFLPHIASVLAPVWSSFEYVFLRSALETAMRRIRNRSGHPGDDVVRQMHAEFEQVAVKCSRHIVDTEMLSTEKVAAEILRRRGKG